MASPTKESLAARFLRAEIQKKGTSLFVSNDALKDATIGDDIEFVQCYDGWECRVCWTPREMEDTHSRLKSSVAIMNRAINALEQDSPSGITPRLGANAIVVNGRLERIPGTVGVLDSLSLNVKRAIQEAKTSDAVVRASQAHIDANIAEVNAAAMTSSFARRKS